MEKIGGNIMSDKLVHVKAYTKDDGTKVKEHYRGGEEAFQDDVQVPLLTGGVSEEVYYPLPDDNMEMEQGFSEAVQVAMAVAQMSISIAAEGMKIVSELKSVSEQSSAKLGIQMEEVVGQMRQAHDVAVSAEQKTLERLSNTTNQREYKELYDTYLAQRESNRATGAIINRIAYSAEHKNYDDVEKGLNEYKALQAESASAVRARANLNVQSEYWQVKDFLEPHFVEPPRTWNDVLRNVWHDEPEKRKVAIDSIMNVAGALGNEDSNMFWKVGLDDVNAYKDYVNRNGRFVESIADLPFDFQDTVRAKVKEQLHVDDAKGVVLRPDSTLSAKIIRDMEFKNFILKSKNKLLNGEVVSGSLRYSKWKNPNLWATLGKADILDTYINKNGDIVSFILDTYDFNPDEAGYIEWGYSVQKTGMLKGFYSIIVLVVPVEEWVNW
ncbi:MAG: hypothetical protein NC390_08170 [Fusobacterium sp.]|nr:hypothetical protein [Fusobacterium sp.]